MSISVALLRSGSQLEEEQCDWDGLRQCNSTHVEREKQAAG